MFVNNVNSSPPNESAIGIFPEKRVLSYIHLSTYRSILDRHKHTHTRVYTLVIIHKCRSRHPPRVTPFEASSDNARTVAGFREQLHSSAPISVDSLSGRVLGERRFDFLKNRETFSRSHFATIGNSRRPSFRVGVAPPPSCSSPRRDDTRKRARCVWNSGRPDLAQRDSA